MKLKWKITLIMASIWFLFDAFILPSRGNKLDDLREVSCIVQDSSLVIDPDIPPPTMGEFQAVEKLVENAPPLMTRDQLNTIRQKRIEEIAQFYLDSVIWTSPAGKQLRKSLDAGKSDNYTKRYHYIKSRLLWAIQEYEIFKIPVGQRIAQAIYESDCNTTQGNEFSMHFSPGFLKEHSNLLMPHTKGVHDNCFFREKLVNPDLRMSQHVKHCKNPDQFMVFKSAWHGFRAHSYLLTSEDRMYKKRWERFTPKYGPIKASYLALGEVGVHKKVYALKPGYRDAIWRLAQSWDLDFITRTLQNL